MQFLLGIIIGLSLSRWLETLLLRVGLRICGHMPMGREAIRSAAKASMIDLGEKGRVVSTVNSSRVQAIKKGSSLTDALDQDDDADTD